MTPHAPALAAALTLALAAPAGAQDTSEGQALAAEHCARCHNIGPGGAMRQMPPDFAAIARYRTPDQIRDRIMFPAMHVNMPRWPDLLRADEIDALVAYVAGLSG